MIGLAEQKQHIEFHRNLDDLKGLFNKIFIRGIIKAFSSIQVWCSWLLVFYVVQVFGGLHSHAMIHIELVGKDQTMRREFCPASSVH